ncbi:MAG: DedA family protein, partial [Mesorhizobium sp.]
WLLRRYGESIKEFIEKRLGMIVGAGAAALILLYILVRYAHA